MPESLAGADEELAGIIERELLGRRLVAPLQMPGFAARLAKGELTVDDWTRIAEADAAIEPMRK